VREYSMDQQRHQDGHYPESNTTRFRTVCRSPCRDSTSEDVEPTTDRAERSWQCSGARSCHAYIIVSSHG
jgi:hypothetical protein